LPDSPRAFLTALGVFLVLALAGMALGKERRTFHIGVAAALVSVATTLAFWQMSPHTSWTQLLFQLFPAPALDESARLIALFVLPAAALRERAAWIWFALGFAAFQGGAAAWLSFGLQQEPVALLAPLTVLALHFALGLGAVAMKARAAPPLLIFCVLALAHGGINGGWIAAMARYSVITIIAAQAGMIVASGFVSAWLLRGSDALRGENRRLD
jgi:hypothetical protein